MKKSCFVLLALAASSVAVAKDIYSAEDHHPTTYAELAFATPVQLPSEDYTVKGLRLNLIYGTSFGVYGLDMGLLGINNASGAGVSLDVLSDWTFANYAGLQLSAFGNVVMGDMTGLQLSGLCNYTGEAFCGAQFGLTNIDGSMCGVQSGLFNYARGESYGLQLGVIDIVRSELNGWSIGAFNYAQRFHGLQLGVVNIAEDHGYGLQLGVFNSAKRYTGVQIGVLNLIDRGDFPILPFVNVQF